MPSNLLLKTIAKVSRIFATTKFFGKFFQKNFSAAVRSASPSGLTLSRSLAACKVRYSVQRLRKDIRLTLCHQNFISSVRFPLESGCKGTDFSETCKHSSKLFLKHFLELIHKYLINKRIKFNNFQDSESKGQRMTPYKFRARAYIGKQKRTHVSIQTNARFIENERTSSSKQTDVFDCWKTTDIHLP